MRPTSNNNRMWADQFELNLSTCSDPNPASYPNLELVTDSDSLLTTSRVDADKMAGRLFKSTCWSNLPVGLVMFGIYR